MKISSMLSRVPVRFAYLAATAVGAFMLFPAASAQAATVTVGSPLTATFTPSIVGAAGTDFNTALPEPGANLTSPITGTIVRWRIAGAAGGPFKLRVLTPGSALAYTGAGTSGPQTPKSTAIETFAASIPIKAGQTIALDSTNGSDKIGLFAVAGSGYQYFVPPIGEGETGTANVGGSAAELGFNADVQPPPGITSISPASGSISGGTSVAITGHDFTGATAVKFGSMPASSFTVNSDTQITATAPPSANPGAVDTSVTTAAGTTSTGSADQFTYTACVVPKLKGKKLKAVKKKLKKADCALGKVKGKKGKSAKVKKQSPKAGKILAPGAKVNVKLGG